MNPATEVWINRLKDPNPARRREAILELETIGDMAALIPLAEVYVADTEAELRVLAQKVGKAIYFAELHKLQQGTGASEAERRQAAEIMAKAQARKAKKR